MKRHGFRKSSVGLMSPAFQSKESNGFFRRQSDKKEALVPNAINDHFFDPFLQRATEEKESSDPVQSKEDAEDKVSMKENAEDEIKNKRFRKKNRYRRQKRKKLFNPK